LIRGKKDHPVRNISKGKENRVWKTAPFLRLLIPLVSGIIIEKYFPLKCIFRIPAFCLSVLRGILCNYFSFQRFVGMNWIAGLAIQFSFSVSGEW
jgi:hypothetical protein